MDETWEGVSRFSVKKYLSHTHFSEKHKIASSTTGLFSYLNQILVQLSLSLRLSAIEISPVH